LGNLILHVQKNYFSAVIFQEKLDYFPAFFPQISKPEAPYKSFIALPNEKASIKIHKEFLDSEILLNISIPRKLRLEATFFFLILKTT